MGYACPVCADAQADGEHLANHLAFTAILGDDDHERWLDEHVPDWADRDPEGLAPAVTARATETDHEPFSVESATDGHPHGENAGARREGSRNGGRIEDELAAHGGYGRDTAATGARSGAGARDPEAERILEAARELTAAMHDEESTREPDGDATADAAEDDADPDDRAESE